MWKTSLLPKILTFGVLGVLIQAPGHQADDLIRTTESGQIQGTQISIEAIDKSVNAFLGIPFAKPPVGALRFSPPQPPDSWSNVRDTTSQPSMCLQDVTHLEEMAEGLKVNNPIPANSEDCLYLNIYAPVHAKEGDELPVMVWIHGGALLSGSAFQFDGSILSATQNVVVVIIQYRLGILGFFSTGDEHAPGNWGYLDQVAALRWVQKNIAHFGGDPGLVTIFGESAGGTSVSSQVLSPMSKGLFHRAIMGSGVAFAPTLFSCRTEMVANAIANLSACDRHSSASMVQCLRSKSEEEILAIAEHLDVIPTVVDGQFFPKHPEEMLTAGEFNHVPSIIGVTNHEYGWLLPQEHAIPGFQENMDKESVELALQTPVLCITPELVPLMMEEYLRDTEDPGQCRAQFQEIVGDFNFVIPSLKAAKYQHSSSSPVYSYEFQHRPSWVNEIRPEFVKADHGDDVPFVFGQPYLGKATEEEKLLSHRIMSYWANFARHGDPNGADLFHWPVYDQEEEYLELNLQLSLGKSLRKNKWEFWTKTVPEKMKQSQSEKAQKEP
ncbi:cocaine esterase-like [Phascolarctos cinereus]|uniref:Carboxylic ester hydrolase n=1 Tax=Phascolarctos cinereus TaxID=38626 RepID=A0A6P5KHH4_PHACI|nr:cocaine esterase-like [Phascolarctos cinereus]